ncbi:hypothetical protein [Aurantimonas sp. VKM B-3413]|uniref:hypothetical protein n=1 Tax=Aurantimonas sp. VKM B-3413 TaxID=2779401 RepID=UPI001E2D4D66|nr:hypothetical protein [Aurantimonas sp. VKM B-3413]MCB8839718.1 hypothetical protein [Aurantimonas sp. VKM B-3413]
MSAVWAAFLAGATLGACASVADNEFVGGVQPAPGASFSPSADMPSAKDRAAARPAPLGAATVDPGFQGAGSTRAALRTGGDASAATLELAAAREPAPRPASAEPLDSAEIAYARDTAAAVFRRRRAERATTFLPVGAAEGYGICIRSPAAKGGYDYALILLSRRLHGEAISQVDDDTPVMRRAADTKACRVAALSFVGLTRG